MLAKHSIQWTIIFYLTNWRSVTFLVIYYDCCCVGIVPNLAVFYGLVLDKEVYYHLFSERELAFTIAILANVLRYVRYMLSAVRLLSVCLLSVCCLSVTLVHPTQAVELFGNFFHHTIAQGLYFSGAKNHW